MAKIKEIGHARFNVEPAGVQNGKDHLENQSSNTMKVTLHLPHDPATPFIYFLEKFSWYTQECYIINKKLETT